MFGVMKYELDPPEQTSKPKALGDLGAFDDVFRQDFEEEPVYLQHMLRTLWCATVTPAGLVNDGEGILGSPCFPNPLCQADSRTRGYQALCTKGSEVPPKF